VCHIHVMAALVHCELIPIEGLCIITKMVENNRMVLYFEYRHGHPDDKGIMRFN